jgi:hypothetical protein
MAAYVYTVHKHGNTKLLVACDHAFWKLHGLNVTIITFSLKKTVQC